MSASFDYSSVDRFVPGTVGEPGRRVFFIQFGEGSGALSLKCEKLHVAALAEKFLQMLRDLPATQEARTAEFTPLVPEWTVGAISLGYDATDDRIVVIFEEVVIVDSDADDEDEDDDDDENMFDEDDTSDRGRARVRVTRAQAATFARLAGELVVAGRPPCVRCGAPIDSDGYNCGCWN